MTAALAHYHARMQRVLDHVDRHLDADLDLDAVSDIAAFSKFHFQRQFAATFGVSLHRYIQLARLKRASWQLAFRDGLSVTEVAMDAGYAAPDAFARAFRQRFGQSPSEFRTAPEWDAWHNALAPLDDARSRLMQPGYTFADISIDDVPPVTVAVMEHRGDPAAIGTTIQRFIAWRRSVGLTPPGSATYNVFHTDPRTTLAADYHMDLCAGIDRPVAMTDAGIRPGIIPGGRCAILRVVGGGDRLEPAALFLYRDWLPVSGEEARDFPLYCRRISFFPEVPENEAVTELYLPLK